jgi:hypothetical protein
VLENDKIKVWVNIEIGNGKDGDAKEDPLETLS